MVAMCSNYKVTQKISLLDFLEVVGHGGRLPYLLGGHAGAARDTCENAVVLKREGLQDLPTHSLGR